jgi:hypothetical protein
MIRLVDLKAARLAGDVLAERGDEANARAPRSQHVD